jgi:hypothetical protein
MLCRVGCHGSGRYLGHTLQRSANGLMQEQVMFRSLSLRTHPGQFTGLAGWTKKKIDKDSPLSSYTH